MQLLPAFAGTPQPNNVYQCAALELLKAMDTASVDLIATDWPYNMDKASWDTWATNAQYLEWMRPHLAEMKRVLKPNGSYYGFASPYLASHVEILTGEYFNVLNRITWRKPPYSTKAEMFDKDIMRGYFPASEAIIFAEQYSQNSEYDNVSDDIRGYVFKPMKDWFRERAKLFNVERRELNNVLGSANSGGGMATHYFGAGNLFELPTIAMYAKMQAAFPLAFDRDYIDLRQQYEELRTEYEELRRPFNVSADVPYTDVWDFATVNTYPGKHPCEKPAAMMQHIVNASSRAGDLVLDCFCGSGATLAAAYHAGRQYIGCDMDVNWVEVARNRCVKEFGAKRKASNTVLDDLPLFASKVA